MNDNFRGMFHKCQTRYFGKSSSSLYSVLLKLNLSCKSLLLLEGRAPTSVEWAPLDRKLPVEHEEMNTSLSLLCHYLCWLLRKEIGGRVTNILFFLGLRSLPGFRTFCATRLVTVMEGNVLYLETLGHYNSVDLGSLF